MAQNTVNYANNPTGPELLDNYLTKEQENILSSNSGVQRPSYAVAGTPWLDTSVTPWLYKIYDGSEDITIGAVNSTTHNFIASGVDETNLVHKSETETITGSKIFSSSPIVPTATSGDSSTKAASTAFVANVASGLQTSINTKANDSNAVHKTGDETIAGNKTFNNAINLANSTWNAIGDDAYIGDMNYSGAVCIKGNNDNTKLMLFNRAQNVALGFYIAEEDNNALKLTNPTYSANAWGSVTAMLAQNLGAYGYVKYNNGLIIQWGTVGTGANFSVTFPTPFSSSASYGIAVAPLYDNGTDAYALNVKNRTSTGFTGYLNVNYNGASYIAIGY